MTDSNIHTNLFIAGIVVLLAAMIGSTVYWVKSLPNIIVSDSRVSITNCDPPRARYAKSICPKMFCKKELIESGIAPGRAEIRFVKAESPTAPAGQFELGAFRYRGTENEEIIKRFRCEMQGDRVVQIDFPVVDESG